LPYVVKHGFDARVVFGVFAGFEGTHVWLSIRLQAVCHVKQLHKRSKLYAYRLEFTRVF